ncbi:MAG: ArsR/SmtB family transcription factor, partial [bacterium]
MSSTIKCLKLISDPTRLRILALLNQDALSVAELQEILGMGQSRISTQLSQLKTAGLVNDERAGKN